MSRSALAAEVRHLRSVIAAQHHRDESDEQLLHAFVDHHDDSAFAVLVRRHGPMVLGVCRRVLRHTQDAEDAFQATFLVLARNTAALRNKAALASFLHGTAYRLAMTAKRAAARRRKHERQTPVRAMDNPCEDLLWREVRTLLDEEIVRLPEKYRSVFVLCCLENVSREEAARRLGLKERTLSSRLAEVRKRLQNRLTRRGVELTALLAAALTTETASALPAILLAKTMGNMVSPAVAALTESGLSLLGFGKAKLTAVLLLAASVLTGAGAWACRGPAVPTGAPPQPAAKERGDDRPKPRTPRKENEQTVEVSGQVLDPDGKPVPQARLYLPFLKGEKLRTLATSDAAGRFSFAARAADVRIYRFLKSELWGYLYVVDVDVMAVAEGHGLGVTAVGDPAQAEKLTIRLAKDKVPIKGRVLDLQGKPVAGVTVRVDGIGVPKKGDLTAFLDDLKDRTDGLPAENNFLTTVYHADFARLCPSATTGADGRFQIKGIGGERLAHLTISGPTIETRQVRVRTRRGEKIQKLASARDPQGGRLIYYGAEFEHAAAPTKPIVGVVRDKNTDKPLANVTIRSHKLAGNKTHGLGFIHTVTDKDGRYRLTGMPKGDGNLIEAVPTESAGYLGLILPVEDTIGLDPVTVNFALRRGVHLKGRVTDKKTGAPVEAKVEYYIFQDNPLRKEFYHSYFNCRYFTDTDGSFRMVVPPGHGLVVAHEGGHQYLVGVGAEKIKKQGPLEFLPTNPLCQPTDFQRFVEIDPAEDAQTLTCHLDLDPGRTLNGTVVGPDGKPLAGARFCGLRSRLIWEHEPLRTAEFTAYALTPARPRNLFVLHEDKRLAGSLLIRGDEKGPVTVKLQPWGTVTGRLVTADGQPYLKGALRFTFVGGQPAHPFYIIPRDKTGRFRIEGLVPGLKYNLGTIEGGKGVDVFRDLTVQSGETKNLGDIHIKPLE